MGSEREETDFVTMGMFIIDEIYRDNGALLGNELLGGGGTYALIGARIFKPPPHTKRLSMIVDVGNDFPKALLESLDQLKCNILIRNTPNRKTTRGKNIYGPGEFRDFEYTTPKMSLYAEDLSPTLLASKTFHLICAPERAVDMIPKILARREEHGISSKPMFLWEPIPGVCSPADWPDCIDALKLVDIISPNVSEGASFLGKTVNEELPFEDFKAQAEKITKEYLRHQVGGQKAVVLRCGKYGCLVADKNMMRWLPAYHKTGEKVVDPTGGGNAFCGAFCIGWLQSQGDLVKAAKWGNVASSFVIEQFGMPELRYEGDRETWNGETVEQRTSIYQAQHLS